MTERLVPVTGCFVCRSDNQRRLGMVLDHRSREENIDVKVQWPEGEEEWVPLTDIRSGFQPGWLVQDVPLSTTRPPLGPGRVVGRRTLAGYEQVLVQLDENGVSVWLPYERLRRIKDVQMRYERAETNVPDHAARFRLRLLAHALENWNLLTGALDRLDVDPLPHQIQLVHRILTSAEYNWLIADDVGLGKTIEVGLLLAALKRKHHARRILIVAPAGLTRQWQDEMKYKFGQSYEIYGLDFFINQPDHWKLHDHVIVSLDLAKRDDHMEKFKLAGGWDVVIFDEAHKLTRYASGERAQRYRLAEMLRQKTDALLLLSGTPHQGYRDRFQAILELVRPDLRKKIQSLSANPDIVREMIVRNRKSEVTDADGNFIFKGTRVLRVPVEPSAATRTFQKHLNDYLRRGYGAGDGAMGRAIGFVMTTYRKLASSSIAAIERALRLRLERLTLGPAEQEDAREQLDFDALVEGGDDQDDLAGKIASSPAHEFFAREHEMIEELLKYADVARRSDEKLTKFLNEVVKPVAQQGKKLLVFTEYRATQSYLKEAIEQECGEAVVEINGSMNIQEKLNAINAFNNSCNFLVSTEAGGEGINLHRACHIMVNYDLPWNPARLAQRIGRLYRYGQQEVVTVFNLHAHDNFDNTAIGMMLERVMTIAREMAPVGSEFNERLYAEILGEVLENVDMSGILQAPAEGLRWTSEQIDEAVARAQQAREMQEELFRHIDGYDPNAMQGTLGFTMDHVGLFVRDILPLVGASVEGVRYSGRALDVRLPDDMRGKFAEFGQRTHLTITTDRRLAADRKDVYLLDFESEFFRFLIERAKSPDFDGLYSSVNCEKIKGAVGAFKLRWQNDQGKVLTEQMITVHRSPEGAVAANPPHIAEWLLEDICEGSLPRVEKSARRETYSHLVQAALEHLSEGCSRFKHPNGLVHLAAADCVE